jgi:hypothetical protein
MFMLMTRLFLDTFDEVIRSKYPMGVTPRTNMQEGINRTNCLIQP